MGGGFHFYTFIYLFLISKKFIVFVNKRLYYVIHFFQTIYALKTHFVEHFVLRKYNIKELLLIFII